MCTNHVLELSTINVRTYGCDARRILNSRVRVWCGQASMDSHSLLANRHQLNGFEQTRHVTPSTSQESQAGRAHRSACEARQVAEGTQTLHFTMLSRHWTLSIPYVGWISLSQPAVLCCAVLANLGGSLLCRSDGKDAGKPSTSVLRYLFSKTYWATASHTKACNSATQPPCPERFDTWGFPNSCARSSLVGAVLTYPWGRPAA